MRAPCGEGHWGQWPQVQQPRPRYGRSAKWGLEDNTACDGQEKKLWVNIAICLVSPHPHPSVSQTTEASTPYERIKRCMYSYKESYGHSSFMYIPHYSYITTGTSSTFITALEHIWMCSTFGDNKYWLNRWVMNHYRQARQNLFTWWTHYRIWHSKISTPTKGQQEWI